MAELIAIGYPDETTALQALDEARVGRERGALARVQRAVDAVAQVEIPLVGA